MYEVNRKNLNFHIHTKKDIHKNIGFTLIEIMVAISISSLLFGIGVVSYLEFNRTQTTKGVGLTIKNNFRSIQTQALAGVKPDICGITTELESYQVDFGANSYTTQAVCSGNPSGPITTYSLPVGFLFDPVPTSLNFFVLGNGVSVNEVVTVRGFESPYRYYGLCISKGGDIKDCGYQKGSPPTCTCP